MLPLVGIIGGIKTVRPEIAVLVSGLEVEIPGTENRIAVARKDFNAAAQRYNVAVRRFPSNLVAGLFGFEKKPYFDASEGADEAPEVQF